MGRKSKMKKILARISLENEDRNKKINNICDSRKGKNKSCSATHSSIDFSQCRSLEDLMFELEDNDNMNQGTKQNQKDTNKNANCRNTTANPFQKPKKRRKTQTLLHLYEKGKIEQDQFAAGERLLRDYEYSFRNKSSSNFDNQLGTSKSKDSKNYNNNEFFVIQNTNRWDRYNKAITSIENLETREIVRSFCIEAVGLSRLDKELGKSGVAEVRLWYGLKELIEYYRGLNREKYKP